MKASTHVLRVVASCLSMAACIILAKDHQNVVTTSGLGAVTESVKYSYSSGLSYLMWSNILITLYGFLLAVVCGIFYSKVRSCKAMAWLTWLLDQSLAYVMLAAASAATEVAYLAKKGNNKTAWQPLCPLFGTFCILLSISLVFSFASAVCMAVAAVLSLQHVFRNFYVRHFSHGSIKTVVES